MRPACAPHAPRMRPACAPHVPCMWHVLYTHAAHLAQSRAGAALAPALVRGYLRDAAPPLVGTLRRAALARRARRRLIHGAARAGARWKDG
eukprot:scaffold132376_cov36-Phaeocystis_antarctica.AAC.2